MSHDHEFSHLDEMDARVRALESLLTEKGYIDPKALDVLVETYETRIGPQNGAKVVAKAWSDPKFFNWLMEDATAAIHSLGFTSRQGEHMEALANDDNTHHMVVCTLCSCYPWSVLGLPPTWYKSTAYRSRAVMDPRGVLSEFGMELPQTTSIEVHDSTAETRYLVIPQRPQNTDNFDEEELAKLVTRNSMIGTGLAINPKEVS